jgi:hypothetical protein
VKLVGTFVFGAVLAGAGLAYYVHERSNATGQSYVEVLRQLPGELRRTYDSTRERALLALEEGLKAARLREDQVERELVAAGGTSPAVE